MTSGYTFLPVASPDRVASGVMLCRLLRRRVERSAPPAKHGKRRGALPLPKACREAQEQCHTARYSTKIASPWSTNRRVSIQERLGTGAIFKGWVQRVESGCPFAERHESVNQPLHVAAPPVAEPWLEWVRSHFIAKPPTPATGWPGLVKSQKRVKRPTPSPGGSIQQQGTSAGA